MVLDMPTLPKHAQPPLKISTADLSQAYIPLGENNWSSQFLRPTLSSLPSVYNTPRIMPVFNALDPRESVRPDSDSHRQHENYENDWQSRDTFGAQGHIDTRYSADTQSEYLDPIWQPHSTVNYIPDIRVNTALEEVYPLPTPHSAPSSYQNHDWTNQSLSPTSAGPSNYAVSHYSSDSASHQFGPYSTVQQRSPSGQRSPSRSPELVLSPLSLSGSGNQHFGPSLSLTSLQSPSRQLYSHREQLQLFKEVFTLSMSAPAGPFVPQQMYKPHTNSDRRRYVEEVRLEAPIYFWVDHPIECGIPLTDALHSRVKRLQNRDETVFEGRGPSISVRLQWPGYRQWSRQIPTKDFRSPPGPITRSKLAKNVAKCVQRFIDARRNHSLEDDADVRWKVGPGQNQIKLDDLILVSMHHVSMGSWQPHLRLRRPFSS